MKIYVVLAMFIATALSLSFFLAWEFIPLGGIVGTGRGTITVHVHTNSGVLQFLRCDVLPSISDAQEMLDGTYPIESHYCVSWKLEGTRPHSCPPLNVTVPFEIQISPCGRTISRYQFKYLVVAGKYQDGRQAGVIVELPDTRITHDVTAMLP